MYLPKTLKGIIAPLGFLVFDLQHGDIFTRIMDEAAEQQAEVAEIDRLIATSIDSTDNDELEAELDALMEEKLPDVPLNVDVDLPNVPTEIENAENVERNEPIAAS